MLKSISGGVMNKKIRILAFLGIGTLLFIVMFNLPASRLYAQLKRLSLPPTVMGGVQVNPRSLIPNIVIRMGGTPVTNAIVRLDDRVNLPHRTDGHYSSNVPYAAITFNMPVKISMRSFIPGEWETVAEGRVTALAEIGSPTRGQVISLRTIDNLAVKWAFTAGSAVIEKLELYQVDTDETFTYHPVAGSNSFNISKGDLYPNQRYQLFLWATLPDFKIRGPASSSSRIEMFLYAGTEFRTTR